VQFTSLFPWAYEEVDQQQKNTEETPSREYQKQRAMQ
jgi:hypothetical protein